MNIPEQLKPLSQKGESFIRDSALAFASMVKGSAQGKKNDEVAWEYFNGGIDRTKFNYLTNIGAYTLPAKMRRVSIQRPPMNLLISQQSRRPYVFSTIVIDQAGVNEKFKNQFFEFLKKHREKTLEKQVVYSSQYSRLLHEQQKMMEQLQQEPENEEQMQQMMQLREALPEIQAQIEQVKDEFEQRMELTKEELAQINDYIQHSYKDKKEILAQKGMKKIYNKHQMKDHSVNFFKDKIVTGKGAYLVDYDIEAKRLIYTSLDSMQLYFPSIPGSRHIEEGPWVAVEDYISFATMIDQYGDSKALNDDVVKEMEYYKEYSYGEDSRQPNANVYTGTKNNQNGISRKRIWWKSPRKVFVKYIPNKHEEGKYFRHYINDEKIYDVKPKKSQGEVVKTYYIYDLFYAVIINDKHVVDGRRIQEPLRKEDDYSYTELPVIGRSYSDINDEPYSLIWSTKDLQDLYDIVNYHRELYIAASGVKGQIIDLAQKPTKMSLAEHQYHKKLGNLYIETVDKAGRKVNSPYNQWKDYDDTISPAIQYLEGIMNSLSEMCKETMGVTRQRMGQIVNSDQVGTSEMSRDQSALVTEILFYETDQIQARAMRRAINLVAKHEFKDEVILQFTNPDLSTEMVKIPAGLLNKHDYDIFVLNSTDEERNMMEIKQLAMQQHAKGMLPFKHMIQMYNKSSVVELQKSVVRWAEEAEKLMMAQQQGSQEAQAQAEQAKIQMENEFKMLVEKDKREIDQMKLQLDQADLELRRVEAETNALLKEKEILTRKETEMLKIVSNRDVEMNYLAEQTRNNQVQEQIQALQLRLQELQIRINAALAVEKDAVKLKEIDTKSKIEAKKNRDKNAIKN